MNIQNRIKLVKAAQEIQTLDALNADELGFMARMLVQTTLPHSDPGDVKAFERTNGRAHLIVQPGPRTGVPYGSYPRLVLAWITTEAVRTKRPELVLGDSLSAFMADLGIVPTGGRWGTITRLREQMRRLFAARIALLYEDADVDAAEYVQVADSIRLWWHPKNPEQAAIWESTVTLSDRFFREITARPVPLDMRVLRALKRSPLGLDLYAWITYRRSYMTAPLSITWDALHAQFGADYSDSKDFRRKVKRELLKIKAVWPDLKYSTPRGRLVLSPGRAHIAPGSSDELGPRHVENPGE